LLEQFYTYSDPGRDPRHHTVSTVFIASADQAPCAGDDAKTAGVYSESELPNPIVFDHSRILTDYFRFKRTGNRPKPQST
ncbi:MAG TPA: hypothetical protein VE616_03470, partial [Candidatus Udaeobacter sp.]|nr:hypothetical protein [Candidatus Udaeobacter sp.]